jgi:hypothetical protein
LLNPLAGYDCEVRHSAGERSAHRGAFHVELRLAHSHFGGAQPATRPRHSTALGLQLLVADLVIEQRQLRELRLRLLKLRPRPLQLERVALRIDLSQQLAAAHEVAFADQDLRHRPVHFRDQ